MNTRAVAALLVGMASITEACAHKEQAAPANAPSQAIPSDVAVATRPANDCEWIQRADVEAIVGPLAEAPRPGDGGCIYSLPIPQQVQDERDKLDKVRAALLKLPGADTSARNKGKKQYDTYGFLLEVDLQDIGMTESVGNAASAILAGWVQEESDTELTTTGAGNRDSVRKALGGWDAPGKPYGGRVGHIRVSVSPIASDFALERDKLDTLAIRVRDRIPDHPFPLTGSSPTDSHDPCALLERKEAEAILGPLLVPPYRTGNDGPFAFANGPSCGYYSAGHRVLILTPHWTGGKMDVNASRGVGGLIAAVTHNDAAAAADTLEGPWDQATLTPDGRLELVKGDRALEVEYQVSSTDEIGALKLARVAMRRLAAAKP